ncbi:hypothetical protein Ahy_A10g051151 isoform C [Arachis hypogaea]|uniref:Uncharacterized protein n=1 Tax=Arachis hypogaea TaxID=3818 RepID=A0A445BBQ6_ARAHY|nr:hypothetical protein Ahy_A10g051151 isoform C [Arachis hypogaea]
MRRRFEIRRRKELEFGLEHLRRLKRQHWHMIKLL